MTKATEQAIERLDEYNATADDGTLYSGDPGARLAVWCVRLADSLEAVLRESGAFGTIVPSRALAAVPPVRCNLPGPGTEFCCRDTAHIGPHSWQYLEPWTEERIQARRNSPDPNPQADDRAVQPRYNGGDL